MAPLTDLGEHRLKDIEGAVSIYQLGDETLPAAQDDLEHEPAASRELLRGQGARARGGARELRTVRGSSRSPGPGGSGKTRLALEAAASSCRVQGRRLLGRPRRPCATRRS